MESRVFVARFYLRSDSLCQNSAHPALLAGSGLHQFLGPVPSHSWRALHRRPWLGALSGPVCVLRVCVCRGPGCRVVWATRPPDVTQGMPAVEGNVCGGSSSVNLGRGDRTSEQNCTGRKGQCWKRSLGVELAYVKKKKSIPLLCYSELNY